MQEGKQIDQHLLLGISKTELHQFPRADKEKFIVPLINCRKVAVVRVSEQDTLEITYHRHPSVTTAAAAAEVPFQANEDDHSAAHA